MYIDDPHKSSWHSNKLLVYNGGIPKTGTDIPDAKSLVILVEHIL